MMRRDPGIVARALSAPVRTFVRESRVRLVLLIGQSGQVLAQQGFTRGYEISAVAALAAAAHSSAQALAGLSGGTGWTHLHHAGEERQLFLAPFETPTSELVMVAIFDRDSTLGLVQHYFAEFAAEVAALPELAVSGAPVSAESFERDLEAGLQAIAPPEWLR